MIVVDQRECGVYHQANLWLYRSSDQSVLMTSPARLASTDPYPDSDPSLPVRDASSLLASLSTEPVRFVWLRQAVL